MCDNPVKAMFHICTQPPPTLPPSHPTPLRDFVSTTLVKEAAKRPFARDLVAAPLVRERGGRACLVEIARLPRPVKFKPGFRHLWVPHKTDN